MSRISEADLVINQDGSVYHLNLLPNELADTVIVVGDPGRVAEVSKYFDRIEHKKSKREFITHTGYLGQKRISVISTGIGTDNIDIVFNEIDALANIDFDTRQIKSQLKALDIIRIGTSGSMQTDIPIGSVLASSHGMGFDNLMDFYVNDIPESCQVILKAFKSHLGNVPKIDPYLYPASDTLLNRIAFDLPKGITATSPGFYAPQGRQVRAANAIPNFVEKLNTFNHNNIRISNFEMETSAIYALANVLGHNALSINGILASRVNFEFAKEPKVVIENTIKTVLERI